MKILIITQSVDKKNQVLGFFHRWIEEFSKKFDFITVICLEKGAHELPANVKVLSLGKEVKASRIKYIFNFYRFIWNERRNYDAVFVHMNEEYVLLGSLLWVLMGKKITMWRNHHKATFCTPIACYICDRIFCTSKYSYTAKFKKTILMPIGIDTESFICDPIARRRLKSILFLGRISPVKKINLLIDALKILKDRKVEFNASIYGDALPKDKNYYECLIKKVGDYNLKDSVIFYKGVPNMETISIYNTHEVSVNLSSNGMFDKMIGEAMMCGCMVLVSNDNLKGLISDKLLFGQDNVSELAEKIECVLSLGTEEKRVISLSLSSFIEEKHSLHMLRDKFYQVMKNDRYE